MTINREHLANMDSSLQYHRQEALREIEEQVRTGELFETHDVDASLCIGGLVGVYANLVANDHDVYDPNLMDGVRKALIAGWHMASVIMPESVTELHKDLRTLPQSPDQSDVTSVTEWARLQPVTDRLGMRIAGIIAEQKGDSSLTTPLATVVDFPLFHHIRTEQSITAA